MAFGRKKTLLDRAHDAVEQVAESVIPTLESALEQTREKAGPALADARERAKPLIEEGKARALEGRDLAAAKVAELKGEEPEPAKGGKVKKFLIFGGLLAVAGLIFKKLTTSPDSANWQSSYVPSPPPAPPTPAASPAATAAAADPVAAAPITGDPLNDPLPGATDDAAGGAPGEALSDAVEEPHTPSSPDAPAEVIDVQDMPKNT